MTRVVRSFEEPDQVERAGGVISAVLEVGGVTVARTAHPPGWRWSKDVRPLVGTERCQARHLGVMLSGRIVVELLDRSTQVLGAGDLFDVPPGHDAWVEGDAEAVSMEWSGVREWLRPRDAERVLATLLFTDIVDSTPLAGRLGDRAWHALLAAHDEIVRRIVTEAHGREVKHTGTASWRSSRDPVGRWARPGAFGRGFVRSTSRCGRACTWGRSRWVPTTSAAWRCTRRRASWRRRGRAKSMVSDIARTLAAASGFDLEARGTRELKGLEGPRPLFALRDPGTRP